MKSFGSKNDWKRHERKQHHQIDAWRCHEAAPNRIGQCATVVYQREDYKSHLLNAHGISDEDYIREQVTNHRIGRSGQIQFWCGFCLRIVKLESEGEQAEDERFDHIDKRHFKRGERIEQWYPPGKDVPKGSLRNDSTPDSGTPSSMRQENESDENSGDEEDNHSPTSGQRYDQENSSSPVTRQASRGDDSQLPVHEASLKIECPIWFCVWLSHLCPVFFFWGWFVDESRSLHAPTARITCDWTFIAPNVTTSAVLLVR